jgi:hypothetical protein
MKRNRTAPACPDRDRLWVLLDQWKNMDDAVASEAAARGLYAEIMGIFTAHPTDAEQWYRVWRKLRARQLVLPMG